MTILSSFETQSVRRLTAVLAVLVFSFASVPSQAEDEIFALAMPRQEKVGRIRYEELFSSANQAEEPAPGSGSAGPAVRVRLESINTVDFLTMDLPLDGQVRGADAEQLAHFFRCRRTGRQHAIAPGVLAMLADVAAHWPDRSIQIVSGFRAPPFGAPHSKHFKGQAIDLRIPGIRTTKLRDYIWRENRGIGVGYYEKEDFVHMDWRAGEQDRAWTGSEEGGAEIYNPRWARRARRVSPSRGTNPEWLSLPFAFIPSAVVKTAAQPGA